MSKDTGYVCNGTAAGSPQCGDTLGVLDLGVPSTPCTALCLTRDDLTSAM